MIDPLAERLESVLRPTLGEGTAVQNLHLLTGGASRMTYAFDAVTANRRRALILRAAPLEGSEHFARMELEADAQRAAAAAGAPVPHILFASDSLAPLGNAFLICDAIAGETIVRRIQRQLDDAGRGRLLVQCAQALVAIHRARSDAAGLVEQDLLTEWRQRIDEMGDTTATFELAYRWLRTHRPAPAPKRLVHGDFRMGNLIVDGGTLAAVLDWELVHNGDIHEDLAWFCIRAWRFGAPQSMAAGGLGGIDEFVTAYEQAGGAPVDRQALHWWMVLGTLRWGMICRYQAERHLSGQTRSVELATIGRRVCETEWDILDLLLPESTMPPRTEAEEERGSGPESTMPPRNEAEEERGSGAGSTVSDPRSRGRPTAAELVAAVAEFLEGEVRATTSGAVNFHALVAANALRIVERELLDESADKPAAALAALGYRTESELAEAIRAGELDGRDPEVQACLRVLVAHRLAISHPGYAGTGHA